MNAAFSPTAPAWEHELLNLALEGLEGGPCDAQRELAQGYALAEAVTRRNSKSFYLASGLLPSHKRRAVRVLYAFCRATDDIVDEGGADAAGRMHHWRLRALAPQPPSDDPILVAWHDVRTRYAIPAAYVKHLIDGIALDMTQTRYETFNELARYCYGVASTVGLKSMHIIGYRDRSAIPYAIKLGVALQLTNILRDIGEDLQRGRIYLPQEDLRRFSYSERDLEQGIINDRFRALMTFQISRTRALYAEAWAGIRLLAPDGRLAIAAAADLYRAILGEIERNDYDVFNCRAHLSAAHKLMRLPSLWRNVRKM